MSEQYNLNNRYQFMGLIGKGRLGDVYRAADNFFRREVALKTLHKEGASPEFIQYFSTRYAQQIAVLAKLNNPAIIKTYDFTTLNNYPAWTMDLYSGTSFSQYAGTKLPVEQAANMLIPVADALTYAHQYGVIHGNLKPNNILFGASQTPVLTDFGLAQWLSDNRHGYGQFEAAYGIGSPEYLAPEQAQGLPVDARTDIYSLGIIFYELITGHKPFSAMTPIDTMALQVSNQIPTPRYYVPNISQQAEQFIYQATAKNPAQRISSMSEFAMTLRSLSSPAASGAYYPPASYYNNSVPSEDDDDDDDEGLTAKIKTALDSIKTNKNAKIILAAVLALIVALIVIGVITGNNRKIQYMNATQTQAAINLEETQSAIQAAVEAQHQQTKEAEEEQARQTQSAVEAMATANAMAAIPTEETLSIPVTAMDIPTVIPQASGRFQSQSPKDGSKYIMGEAFNVVWTIENTGSSNWNSTYKLVFDSGVNFSTGLVTERNIGVEIWPHGAAGITLPCTAPYYTGDAFMQWHVEDDNGNTVFDKLSIQIKVVDGVLTPTPGGPTEEPTEVPTETPEFYIAE